MCFTWDRLCLPILLAHHSESFSLQLNYSKQQEIAAKLDKKMMALEGVRLLRQEAERRIERIIVDVWGEEGFVCN